MAAQGESAGAGAQGGEDSWSQAGGSHRKARDVVQCSANPSCASQAEIPIGMGCSVHWGIHCWISREQGASCSFVPTCSGHPKLLSPIRQPPSGASFKSGHVGAPSDRPQHLKQDLLPLLTTGVCSMAPWKDLDLEVSRPGTRLPTLLSSTVYGASVLTSLSPRFLVRDEE